MNTQSPNAGRYRFRAKLFEMIAVRVGGSNMGQPSEVAEFWCDVIPQRSADAPTADQVMNITSYKVLTPWGARLEEMLTPEKRIVTSKHNLEIVGVTNVDEQNIQLEIDCTEVK